MNRNFKYLIVLFLLLVLPISIKAAPSQPGVTHIDADLYYATSDTSTRYILVGQDINNVDTYGTTSGASYITVPNGTYYVWAKDSSGNISEPTTLNVTQSCNNVSVVNATGAGTAERCYMVKSNKSLEETTNETLVTCAANYFLDQGATATLYNDCERKTFSGYNLSYRYCKKTFQYKCSKGANAYNLKLSNLSINTGSLTPNFSATNYTYSSTTTADKVTVSATLQDNSATFVSGFGPRSVSLNYGLNNIYVKTSAPGGANLSYLIKLTRTDTRNSNNNLSSLSVDGTTLSPSFKQNTLNYTARVNEDVEEVTVNATLASESASFLKDFGPRNVKLNKGYNKVAIKVRSQSGAVRVYNITIIRGEVSGDGSSGGSGEGGSQTPGLHIGASDKALLKELSLSDGTITFDKNVFDYNVVVEYGTSNIAVVANAEDPSDNVVITGGEDLEVGGLNEIAVTVTTPTGDYSNTYTIYVERREENITISNDSLLKDLSVNGYKLKFDAKQTDYELTIKDNVKELEINAEPNSDRASVTIEGNENLVDGSEIKIRVTAEDNSYTDYFIKVSAKRKGGNVFLTIFVIIIIILVLAYLVLRAMGYKIYLNFDAVKDFFKKRFAKKD